MAGNNSNLLKKCMLHRTNWKECQNSNATHFNLKWQPVSSGTDYDSFNRTTNKQVRTYLIRLLTILKAMLRFQINLIYSLI